MDPMDPMVSHHFSILSYGILSMKKQQKTTQGIPFVAKWVSVTPLIVLDLEIPLSVRTFDRCRNPADKHLVQ
jgi:hypothetical protein